jgi:hypothetical protein
MKLPDKKIVVAENRYGWKTTVQVDGVGVHLSTDTSPSAFGMYLSPDEIDRMVLTLLKNKKYANEREK